MGTEIIPTGGALARRNGGTAALSRQTSRRLAAARDQALIEAAHIQAAAYVAHVAMTTVAQISAEEALLIQQYPLAEPRLKVIADTFAGVACAQVAQMNI